MKKLMFLLLLLLISPNIVQARWGRPTPTPRPTATPRVTPTPTRVPTPTPTPTPNPVNPNRVNPMCVASHLNWLSSSPSEITKQLNLMQQAGIRWTRFDFEWDQVEAVQGTWDFSLFDSIVTQAASRGINIIAMLPQWGSPDWSWTTGMGYMSPMSPDNYAMFASNLATHFKGKITLYELGNEPNIDGFWGNTTPDAASYSAMLKAGSVAIRAVDSNAKIISAGIAPITSPQGVVAWDYIYTMFNAGLNGYIDYIGYHPYSWPASPDFTQYPATFSEIDQMRSIAQSYGVNVPFMVTEVGWPSTTASGGVTEATQASYIDRVFKKVMLEGYQYVQIACVYDFKDDGTDKTNAEDNFGVIRTDFTKKPSYTSVLNNRNYFNSHFNEVNP